MAAKNVILKRKIGTDIFELLPKTSDANVQVTYGTAMTLASALADIYTDLQAWETFKADVDFAGQDAALDTLRELIDMISKEDQDGSVAAKLAQMSASISTLQTTHANDISTLQGTIADNKESADNAIDALDERVTAAEGTITEHTTAISTLQNTVVNGVSRVYASATQPETLNENDLWIELVDSAS